MGTTSCMSIITVDFSSVILIDYIGPLEKDKGHYYISFETNDHMQRLCNAVNGKRCFMALKAGK